MAAEKANFGLKTKIIGLLSFVLLMLLIVDIAWTYESQKRATEAMLLEESRVLVTEMDAVWDFISINQDTINYTLEGAYEYKGLHCAIAGKSVAAFFSQNSDYTIRFTNITPRNIHNTPDAYESEALAQFAEHPGDPDREMYYGFAEYQGESVFRYVSAMKVTEHCIECHGAPQGELDPTGYEKEGWQTGDLAGAVSVIVPTQMYYENMAGAVVSNVLFFLAIMLCMATIIYVVLTRLITRPLEELRHSLADLSDGSPSGPSALPDKVAPVYASREIDELFAQFDAMASSLSSLYGNLESEVDERTMQLSAANEELERQRRHVEEVNDKLKRENQYKSDFLTIVSHELRTPLTSILAFARILRGVDSLDAKTRSAVEEIEANATLLLNMVNNILTISKAEAHKNELVVEPVDFVDLLGFIRKSLEPVAKNKGIALTAKTDADVPVSMADWEKLRRIVENLVDNAIKYTHVGGRVDVRATFDGACIVVSVADDGMGIDEADQEGIFERYRQAGQSPNRRYRGTGLGLAVVKELAELHGGSVSVASARKLGSTFTVRIPYVAVDTEEYDEEDPADR